MCWREGSQLLHLTEFVSSVHYVLLCGVWKGGLGVIWVPFYKDCAFRMCLLGVSYR